MAALIDQVLQKIEDMPGITASGITESLGRALGPEDGACKSVKSACSTLLKRGVIQREFDRGTHRPFCRYYPHGY